MLLQGSAPVIELDTDSRHQLECDQVPSSTRAFVVLSIAFSRTGVVLDQIKSDAAGEDHRQRWNNLA